LPHRRRGLQVTLVTELAPAAVKQTPGTELAPTGGGSYVFVITAESSATATLPIGGTLTIGWYLASGTNTATML
jgi:hypothetical protein